jgi:hypothetical protein
MPASSIVGAPAPTILLPADTRSQFPDLFAHGGPDVWVYRYTEPTQGWRLSIATCAAPNSGKLSLGGFRIAPEERTSAKGFNSDHEAVGLAIGMDEKVQWSRLMRIGGPLARRDSTRIVGGKCVLHPTPDARVGQPQDKALLDFATACLNDAERRGGFHITTGQDLGHGIMSDGHTESLTYLHERFPGSVVADTSKPTGEGNYYTLSGMLRGFDIPVSQATVGLIGCGNIGLHVFGRLREFGATVIAVESNAQRRAFVQSLGVRMYSAEEKAAFLREPMDALVVNAAGGSLDPESIALIGANERLRVICGSENLVMPDEAAGSEKLRAMKKAYAPTELGGMMGYLTAVEQYLATAEGVPFNVQTLFDAASQLEEPCVRATRLVRERNFAIGFADAMREVCSTSET